MDVVDLIEISETLDAKCDKVEIADLERSSDSHFDEVTDHGNQITVKQGEFLQYGTFLYHARNDFEVRVPKRLYRVNFGDGMMPYTVYNNKGAALKVYERFIPAFIICVTLLVFAFRYQLQDSFSISNKAVILWGLITVFSLPCMAVFQFFTLMTPLGGDVSSKIDRMKSSKLRYVQLKEFLRVGKSPNAPKL